MNIIKKAILAFVFAIAIGTTFAQIKPLNIGDRVSNLTLNNILNYKKPVANLEDFKGKILILDFWATWCSPCIGMMPVTDSLQKKFNGKIEFMPVTYQKTDEVKKFSANIKRRKNIDFYSIVEDTVLTKMFTHAYMPFYVWIDGTSGKVLGWCHLRGITEENIEKVLKGEIPSALQEEKELKKEKIDTSKPLFAVTEIRDFEDGIRTDSINQDVFFHSSFTKHIDKYGSAKAFSATRFTAFNTTISSLLKAAYGGENWSITFTPKRFFWEVNDPKLYYLSDDAGIAASKKSRNDFNEWKLKSTFCYELYGKFKDEDAQYSLVQTEVNKYLEALFGLKGSLEKRQMEALVLTRTTKSDKLKFNGIVANANDKFRYSIPSHFESWQKGNSYPEMPPLVDETGYKGYVNIELKSNLADLTKVNEELSKYDLKIVKENRLVDVLVVKKVKP